MNFIVETRNEFTIQLVKILSPFLYEGFDSIYKDTINLKSNNSTNKIFKIFQQFIKKIPSWNKSIITMETNRILSQSRCNYLLDLIKAVIKSNILLLSGNSKVNNLNIEDYLDINISDFIHKCYIECARQFYSLPYLFSNDFKIIERKKNQKECFEIIDLGIREVVRTFLPIDNILKNYLAVDFLPNITENDDIKTISDNNLIPKNKINTLINSDVVENFKDYETVSSNQTNNCNDDDKETSNLIKDIKNKFNSENFNQNMENKLDKIINNIQNNSSNVDNNLNINKKIDSSIMDDNLNIFEQKNPLQELSNYNDKNKSSISNDPVIRFSERQNIKDDMRDSVKESIRESIIESIRESERNNESNNVKESVRDSVNKSLSNYEDIKGSELNNSISYKVEHDSDYEDVFSNLNDSYDLTSKKKRKDEYFSKFNNI